MLGTYAGLAFPGAAAGMPAGANQQVAGFTPAQQAAMGGIGIQSQATGPASQLAYGGANQLGSTLSGQFLDPNANPSTQFLQPTAAGGFLDPLTNPESRYLQPTLSGQFLDPSTNPWLKGTFNQAAQGVTDQYRLATAPSLQVAAQQAGVAGGSAANEQQQYQQFGLGQNLNNLATDIYGPAYAQERQNQMTAAQQLGTNYAQAQQNQLYAGGQIGANYAQERANQFTAQGLVPSAQGALYTPADQLLGIGALQQSQQQTQLNAARQNTLAQTQYPYQLLSGLGGILGQATGGAGTSISTQPNPGALK